MAAVDDLGLNAMAAAEESLVELARLNGPWELREAIRTLEQTLDQDSVDERQRRAMARRHLSVIPGGDEYVVKGVLVPRPA